MEHGFHLVQSGVELGCVVAGVAARPTHALDLIGSTEIDAAVLDVNLDGADSFGLFRPSNSTFYLKNTHATGVADLSFPLSAGRPIAPSASPSSSAAKAAGSRRTCATPATPASPSSAAAPPSFNPIVRLQWPAPEQLYLKTAFVRVMPSETINTFQRWHLLNLSAQAAVLK